MSRFDRMTTQDWAIRDAINDVLQENNRPTSDYIYSVVPDETPAIFVEQPSAQEAQTADPVKVSQAVAPYVDYFSLLNPGETPASALESKLSQLQSMPDLSTDPVSSGKWWAGDTPTYAESVAQLYRMQNSMTPEQFDAYAARLDAAKNDPASGFYQNPYTGITSPYVDAISKLGIDVSGGINDEWIAKNQYLLQGARYTDAGTTPAAPTKTSTAAQNAAYYYYQIQRNYNDTKEVLNEEAALRDEIAYWVSRDDLNLSDDQILERLDWKGKYKYLQGLKNAQSDGHVYNYTQPIDYNPDNLRGYIWAARNDGGSGNAELDAVNAALGRGNVWKENKEISDKLDFRSDAYSPYSVKSTLDDAAQYFGVKEFEPGWAEKVAKTKIDWNNPDDVKYWQQVYNAESFTEQAEAEVKEIYDRIDTMIAAGIVDPATIEDGLWDKGLDGSAALTALKKLDASMVRPDKLEGTTRPIDYRKQDVQDYIKQQCAKATEKETLPDFGMRVTEMMGTNTVHGEGQGAAPVDVTATVAPTQTPGVNPTDQPRGTEIAAADRILSTPAPSATPAPVKPTPPPVVDQTAKAVNTAQSKVILDSAKTILATGTPDEKMVLNLAPTANAESVAAEMAGSVQTGTANAGALYDTTAQQAQDFTAAHYMTAKMAIKHYDDLQANLTALQEKQAELQRQHDQVQYQIDRGIVPSIAQTEVQINGETHVFTADYDPTSKEYIIHDSNPTDDAEVERQKADYANTLRYGLNMDETYLEQDNQLLVAAEDLNMQLTAINQQVANAQKMVDGYKMRYDQAQGELKTSESMINAAAMQSVWRANPGMDLSTPEGQKAMAEALDEQSKLTKSIDLLMDVSGTYKPTEWAPTTVLDNMLNNGFDAKTTALAANGIIREADKELAALDQAEATVQAAGVSIPGDSNNIKRAREQAQQRKQEAEDFKLRMNEDFDQVVADAKKEILANGKPGLALYAADPSLDQAEVTLADNLSMLAQAGNVNIRDAVQPHTQSYMGELTQAERDTYLYKLAKEGEQAAWDYYNGLAKYVDVRRTNEQNEEMAAFAKEMPVLAAIASIGISPDTIKSAGYVAASLISGQEINPYSKFFDTTWATKTLDQNAKEKILEPLEEGSLVKKIAGIGYDAVTSGAKSLLNSALTAPFAGGSAFLGAVPMGIQAAGAAAQEAKLQGGSDMQAALMAGVTFAAETLSETITTQNIAQAIDSGAKGVKGAMKKVLANDLAEEFFGESANQFVESIADTAIMGELSQRNQKIKEYEQTMSHAEAVKQADKDFWTDVLAAGVTGALSAAGTSGISYAAGRLTVDNTRTPSIEGQVRANALANGLPLDRATQDMTSRIVTMLTSSLNADKGSQVQALSAALFPVSGDAQGQRAAISAGLHMANQFGSEQAVAVAQDVILAAAQEGTDQQAVSEAMRIAALGQGEAFHVLQEIAETGITGGDVQALVDAAGRDAQNPAIADRMNAIIHNDRVASRTRDLIGQGALNGVKPYEQAYSQAKAQEAQTQQNLEAEQERAQAIGEHLKTVQAQHVEDPTNQALAGAMKQAVKDVAGQVKVVGEYQQGLENQQQKTQDAEKDLNRVREEAMTKVREQAMADVRAEEQAEAEEAAAKLEKARADVAAKLKAEAEERAEKQKRIKEQYPNAPEGDIGFDKDGKPWFMGEYYMILPERGSDGYYIQDKEGGISFDEQERLKAAGLTYNHADGTWHGAKDINVIFNAMADNQQQAQAGGVERMIKPKDNTVMNEKAEDDVPTLVGELPPDTEGNESTENLPERETYTLDLSAGTPPSGNGPATAAETPPVNGPQRQFGSRTAQRSNLLHEEVKQYLRENSSYDPDSNNEQLDRAAGWVQEHSNDQDPDGYYGAIAEAQSPDFNAFSADGQARMLTLMSMAALRGDVATETALADAYNQQGTVLGRALQSRQIFGMLTPLGRQAVLLKETDRINKQYADRGQTTRVALSPDTLDKAGKAKTAEDFQRVQKQAYKELAEQMPPTWKDKLQAWRMLSMLGNPRTHVRNFFGNWLFMPAVKLKNVIGTAIEGVAVKPGSGEMRTKSLTVSKENRDFAKADAIKMKDVLTGESKYNPDQKVEQERKIFGTKDNFLSRTVGKALQWLSDKNSEWLEKEDWAFLHRHYENALGGWMNANKLTPETITPEQLTQAREYAINEAQKATYRDANKIASLLADISRKGGVPGFIVDTALPFKKTPANILKRGIEYSPIGLIRTLAADTKKVKQYTDWVKNGSKGALPKNAISPTQYIDRISSGLSGTATAALGALFASFGLVTVGYDDDKKTLEELEGKQEYALNIKIGDANVSYTIDWAAPSCMPFFVGASIYNIFQEGINDPGQIADALLEITEPVFNLSMLDGVNSLMETSQWSGGNAFTQIGEKLVTNYLSSFIPTALGQVSRTIDPVRRKSYVESGAPMSTVRYAFEQAQNKTPFSVSNIPYRNVWGDEDRSPEWLAAIENFISPGYISKITPGKVEKELARLYDETGDAKVIPQAASKSPYIGGQQVKLNAEQYDQYTTVRGTTAKKLLEELMDRPEWALLDGEAKIDIIGQAWTYSNAVAAKDLFPNSKMTAWIQAAQKKGNAAEAIIQRHEEQAKKDYINGHKTSLFKAVDEGDGEAFQVSAYALMEADQQDKAANGKKPNPSYVSNLLINHYKPLYIAAIQDDDMETANTIRENLLNFPSGIDAKTFYSWDQAAGKKNDVRQNRIQ